MNAPTVVAAQQHVVVDGELDAARAGLEFRVMPWRSPRQWGGVADPPIEGIEPHSAMRADRLQQRALAAAIGTNQAVKVPLRNCGSPREAPAVCRELAHALNSQQVVHEGGWSCSSPP